MAHEVVTKEAIGIDEVEVTDGVVGQGLGDDRSNTAEPNDHHSRRAQMIHWPGPLKIAEGRHISEHFDRSGRRFGA